MGETWSVPAMAYVAPLVSARKSAAAGGVDFVAFMGSGYGTGSEGSALFTLDTLTGDVVRVANTTTPLTGQPAGNAIVASPSVFIPGRYKPKTGPHPAAHTATRVYVGDLHGQMWKTLVGEPQGSDPQAQTAILAASLGPNQPIATPAALLGLPPGSAAVKPYIYAATGNDTRYTTGPFKYFALWDQGDDTTTATTTPATETGITTYPPVTVPLDTADSSKFLPQQFASGGSGSCGATMTESPFRGDVQPATAYDCSADNGACDVTKTRGVVFFAGNRLNLPNTRFAPPTPLAYGATGCGGGKYPCRSSFDSIVYALGATSGDAAYDLGGSDKSYRIFYDSRTGAINMQADPDPTRGGTKFNRDETLVKPAVPIAPPPKAGIPPNGITATSNVLPFAEAGKPVPSVGYGSSVCQ